jgi:hypothetical protein
MKFLDIFFTAFHSLLILFILFGWLWKKTRRLNLICILLTAASTAASWGLLGIFYGLGYCPLTDWHFNILRKLGHTDLPTSYISFLFTRISGLPVDQGWVDAVTLWGLVIAAIISILLNFRHRFLPARDETNSA